MASETIPGIPHVADERIVQMYYAALQTQPANDRAELSSALQVVETVAIGGMARAYSYAVGFMPERVNTARRTNEDNYKIIATGTEIAHHAFDVVSKNQDGREALLDPMHGYPSVVRWLNMQARGTGIGQRALAKQTLVGKHNLSVTRLSQILNNEEPDLSLETVLSLAGTFVKFSDEPREEYLATAQKLYEEYRRAAGVDRHIRESVAEARFAPAYGTPEQFEPAVKQIGATVLRGLRALSEGVNDLKGPARRRAGAMVERHYGTLYAYLRLARLSFDTVFEDPNAAERLLDPVYDLPVFFRSIRQEMRRLVSLTRLQPHISRRTPRLFQNY